MKFAMHGRQRLMRSVLALAASLCGFDRAAAQTPPQALAAQIRTQGYACKPPLHAMRDTRRSRPDEAVWILHCGRAAYRIRLDPDMAAHVERLNRRASTLKLRTH